MSLGLGDRVEGLVVCKVGDFRLAFPANTVTRISDWLVGDAPAPQSRKAFKLPPINGRLVEEQGGGLVVDSLEISAERVPLLPVPAILMGEVGGSLQGFIELGGELCPVLSVADFSRYLSRSEP
jgi:hypothetical protein